MADFVRFYLEATYSKTYMEKKYNKNNKWLILYAFISIIQLLQWPKNAEILVDSHK